jgi:hypothetical protein
MKETNYNSSTSTYNTSLNILGGLRDSDVIIKAMNSYFDQTDSLNELVKNRNELNLRTERSRDRVERAVRREFLNFRNSEHEMLMQQLVQKDIPLKDKELILLWQLALNNRFFREITAGVFVNTYYSGRATISKQDIIAYIKEFITSDEIHGPNWSEKTVNTLSTKYLNLMSKLNFLSEGRVKSFHHIRPSSQAQALFLYFAKLYSPDVRNLLTNEFLPLIFMPKDDLQDRLKKLSMKGWFDMNYNGIALNIDLTHSYKEICHVLYQ